jgi:transposase
VRVGMTCWRRLHDWNEAGVWERLHRVLLDELQDAEQLDWSRAAVDSSHVRAKGGAQRPAPHRSTVAGRAPSTT